MEKIKQKLEELYDVLAEISPVQSAGDDPFGLNADYSDRIGEVLNLLVSRAEEERAKIEKENTALEAEIEKYSRDLKLEAPPVPKVMNAAVKRSLLSNERDKLVVARNKLKCSIQVLLDEVEDLRRDLDDPSSEALSSAEVSLARLEALKKLKAELVDKARTLESKRQDFYDEIISLNCWMSRAVEFTYDEKIGELRKMLKKAKEEHRRMQERHKVLLEAIARRESILNVNPRVFDEGLSDALIAEMGEYDQYLKEEQNRQFDEIFDRTLSQIREISSAVGRDVAAYPKTEDSLAEMRRELDKLYPMRELYIEICGRITRRRELLEKMTEFEKIASDPKRLFKSSFQLNSEEKFRNSAYPSLLKMEEGLFDMIDKFEEDHGMFMFEGRKFRAALKAEIENRIINRTVFISRCDSPFRKKK